jgi:hypothetical protein
MLAKVLGSFDELAAFWRRFGRCFGGSLAANTFFGPRFDPPRVALFVMPIDEEEALTEGRPRPSPRESILGLSFVVGLEGIDAACGNVVELERCCPRGPSEEEDPGRDRCKC